MFIAGWSILFYRPAGRQPFHSGFNSANFVPEYKKTLTISELF